MNLHYRGPGDGGRDELLRALSTRSDDDGTLRHAMVDAVFNLDDWQWLQSTYLGLLTHPDWRVRALAATCLGHVATFFDRLDVETVVPELEKLKQDPRTRGYVEAALEDIGTERPMRYDTDPGDPDEPEDEDPDE